MEQFVQDARDVGQTNSANPLDAQICGVQLYYLPVETRVPLKFGTETLTSVTCARARISVRAADGRVAVGWGETPLSVQWVWPSSLPYARRFFLLKSFCELLAADWASYRPWGHALETGYGFQRARLPGLLAGFNESLPGEEQIPYLAALLCCSCYDIALHDAYGKLHNVSVYATYRPPYMNEDLAYYFQDELPAFQGQYPEDFLLFPRPEHLVAWHLVGGVDAVDRSDLRGDEPDDGYPCLLADWIERDGLKCLKVKLRGNDPAWDYQRLCRVGHLGQSLGVQWLSADYNCTVTDPGYVTSMLERLQREEPSIADMILYVEQPFPYDMKAHPIEVSALAARKPLFMDESADDWQHVRHGHSLGWNGVALKTCKTQTGALLSLCWAKAHGMSLMVQDLTNPMLAQIPHVLLAAHAGTLMGVETNAMQFYPEASVPEAAVHPGLYRRRAGQIDLSSIAGPGFGYRTGEIQRQLPPAATTFD